MMLLACVTAGCGQRNHDHPPLHIMDAGPPPLRVHDAGPIRVDSGPPPVDAGSCSESPCRLVAPQCGCAAGEGCRIDNTGARICGISGALGEGQTCTRFEDCAPGLLCIGISQTYGVCARFCDTDAGCTAGAGSVCWQRVVDDSGAEIPDITLCTSSCDPVTTAGCPTGAGCALWREGSGAMQLFTQCRAAGTRGTGQSCTSDVDCTAGHYCDSGADICVQWCRYPSSAGCGSRSCHPFATPLRLGGVEYGYCS